MKRKRRSCTYYGFPLLKLPFDMLVLLIGTFLDPFDIRNLALVGNYSLLKLSREDRIWKLQIEKRIRKELKEGETLKEGEENWKKRFRLTCFIGDWDPTHCGKHVTINGKKMKKISGDWDWNVNVLGTIPGSYKVRISQGNNRMGALGVMIGLAPQTAEPDGQNCNEYGLYLQDEGTITSQNDIHESYLDYKLKDGDAIEVVHNRDKKTIGYIVNGKCEGIAFYDVPDFLFPSIEIFFEGNEVELIC